MSEACVASEGITLIGSADHPKKVVARINELSKKLCELQERYYKARYKINIYCTQPPLEVPVVEEPVVPCFPVCDCEEGYVEYYQVNDTHITTELLEYLTLIEESVCATEVQINNLELEAELPCSVDYYVQPGGVGFYVSQDQEVYIVPQP